MSTERPVTTGRTSRDLVEIIVASPQWKVFFAVLAVFSSVISIYRDVGSATRSVALGILLVAFVVLTGLLLRDVYRWWGQGSYYRDNAYNSTANLLGVGYEALQITGQLAPDGSMTIRRKARLKAFADAVTKIDYYMYAREAPSGRYIEARAVDETAKPFGRKDLSPVRIHFSQSKRANDMSVGVLTFDRPLVRGVTYAFEYEDRLPAASFALTPGDLKTETDYEFFAYDITRPVKELSLKVILSPRISVWEADHDAWMGMTRMTHDKEYARNHSGWIDQSREREPKLSLSVPGPILGLSYAITWKPGSPG